MHRYGDYLDETDRVIQQCELLHYGIGVDYFANNTEPPETFYMRNVMVPSVWCDIQKIRDDAVLPSLATPFSAGFDLHACLPENSVTIQPGETYLVPLGFRTSFSEGYAGLIYARSGLATKKGLAPANCVGVIDSDYRGEWMVPLHNSSKEPQAIMNGERVAQCVFSLAPFTYFNEVDEIDTTDSERGEGGFGSTGSK